MIGSRAVTILQVNIINDFAVPNNDGIDIDSSKLVWVSGANITAWDDAMCIKANYRAPTLCSLFLWASVDVWRAFVRSAARHDCSSLESWMFSPHLGFVSMAF